MLYLIVSCVIILNIKGEYILFTIAFVLNSYSANKNKFCHLMTKEGRKIEIKIRNMIKRYINGFKSSIIRKYSYKVR